MDVLPAPDGADTRKRLPVCIVFLSILLSNEFALPSVFAERKLFSRMSVSVGVFQVYRGRLGMPSRSIASAKIATNLIRCFVPARRFFYEYPELDRVSDDSLHIDFCLRYSLAI